MSAPDVKVGSRPVQIAIDPTDKYAYVANSGDNTVVTLHINGDGTVSTGTLTLHDHGKTLTISDVTHLPGSPWTIAFVER